MLGAAVGWKYEQSNNPTYVYLYLSFLIKSGISREVRNASEYFAKIRGFFSDIVLYRVESQYGSPYIVFSREMSVVCGIYTEKNVQRNLLYARINIFFCKTLYRKICSCDMPLARLTLRPEVSADLIS